MTDPASAASNDAASNDAAPNDAAPPGGGRDPDGPAASPSRPPWRAAVLALLLLFAAAPPAAFPGAGLLVLPGLAALYAVVSAPRHAGRWAFAVGGLHVLLFSASLRHVLLPGWLLMGPVAGLYALGAVAAWRGLVRWRVPPSVAFGLAWAAVELLRADAPQIPYPHGQPIHALASLPSLLGPVAWGGEVLGNLCLAALAAVLVDLARSWRLGIPSRRATRGTAIAVVGATAALLLVPAPRAEPRPAEEGEGADRPVRVLLLEPGLGPRFQYENALIVDHLLRPTARRLAADAAAGLPPWDLVVWPESGLPGAVELAADGGPPRLRIPALPPDLLPEETFLLTGTLVLDPAAGAGGNRLGALLLDHRFRYRGHQEKRVAVPGGESIPFADWLPGAWKTALLDAVERQMGARPDFRPGPAGPPLRTPGRVPFGALTCFDAAFPAYAAEKVADGARFLVVLTNESWYLRGYELAQMSAMQVLRAVETGTPVLRCTADGETLVVGADGRVRAALPVAAGERPVPARFLGVSIHPGPGRLPPMPWRPLLVRRLVGLAAAAGFLHSLARRARLLRRERHREA